MCGAMPGVQPPLKAMREQLLYAFSTSRGLYGRIGPGPTQKFQSISGGGSLLGGLPIPSGP